MTIVVNSLTTSVGAIYSSTGNSAVTSLTLCNYSASNVTANLFVVPNSSSPSTNNIMLANLLIQSNDTYQIYAAAEKLLLGPGDAIYANAQISGTITAITSYTSI
jgi:hypothetical protein